MGFRILKRGDYFYVRIWVPLDVRAILNRSELKKSLRTSSKSDARVLASGLLHKAETAFMRMRANMLTDRQLEILAGELISEFTGTVDKSRRARQTEFDALEAGLPVGLSPVWDSLLIAGTYKYTKPKSEVLEHSTNYQSRIDQLSDELMTGIYSDYTRGIAKHLVIGKGLDVVLPPSEWFNVNENSWHDEPPADFGRLCESVVAALRTSYQLEHERVNGVADSDFRRNTLARIEETKPKPKLSDLWEGYKKYKNAKGKWGVKTASKNRDTFNEALKIIGDRELADYKQDTALDLLAVLKKNGNSAATVSGKVEFISSLFKFALKTPESIEKWRAKGNPFVEMQTRDTVPVDQKKIPYTADDLRALLTGLLKVRKLVEPHRFWVPLIALYSGMRQNEICQLQCANIEVADGVLVFRIRHNPAMQQTVKAREDRTCPVHPMLKRLGFIEYLEQQRKAKQGRLFSTLTFTEGKGWCGKVRGWWNESFQEKHITDTTRKSFHSFRHVFINWFKQNMAYDAGSDRAVVQSMVGHDGDDGVTSAHYEQNFPPSTQMKMLKKLDYGINPDLIEALARKEY